MSVFKVNGWLVVGYTGELTILVHVVVIVRDIRSEVVGDVVGYAM